jgi:excisionase family DNA binding protein
VVNLATREEAASALRMNLRSIDRLISSGALPSVKIRAKRLIPMSSIERLATPTPANDSEGTTA